MPQASKTLIFLEKLSAGFQSSMEAYRAYQAQGKTFALAEIIRAQNQSVRQLLSDNIELLSPSLQIDANELLYHYKVWTEKWDDLKEQVEPRPNDEFIFANAFTFPRAAANRMMDEYDRLKNLT